MENFVTKFIRSVVRRTSASGELAARIARAGRRLSDSHEQIDRFGRRLSEVERRLVDMQRRILDLEHQVEAQRRPHVPGRLRALEVEMQECRQLNRRVAELVDVVGQVLVPALGRDEQKLRQRLTAYGDHLSL